MAARKAIRRLPSLMLVSSLVLAGYYLIVFRPLSQRAAALDRPLLAVWESFVATNSGCESCAGVTLSNAAQRLELLQSSLGNLQAAHRLVQTRLQLAPEIRARMSEPFLLIEFQNERQQGAEQLMRLAKEKGVVLEPAVTNGLPEYSADLADPRLLWPRLHLAVQGLLAAVHTKVGTIRSLSQLPSVSLHSVDPSVVGFEELPMRLELVGPTDALARFAASLPLRGEELKGVGLAEVLTNKPVYFVSQVLVRKAAPDRPGEAVLELNLSGLVSTRPERSGLRR